LEPPRTTNVKLSPDGLLRSIYQWNITFLVQLLTSRNHAPHAPFADEEEASLEPPRTTNVKLSPDGLLRSFVPITDGLSAADPNHKTQNNKARAGSNIRGGHSIGEHTEGEQSGGENTGGEHTDGKNTGGGNTGGGNTGGGNTGGVNTGGGLVAALAADTAGVLADASLDGKTKKEKNGKNGAKRRVALRRILGWTPARATSRAGYVTVQLSPRAPRYMRLRVNHHHDNMLYTLHTTHYVYAMHSSFAPPHTHAEKKEPFAKYKCEHCVKWLATALGGRRAGA